jgi:hypothetical protein
MIISQQQHSELVTVVILSAFVPTLVAQQPFQPGVVDVEEEEALGAEDAATIRRHWGRGFLPGRSPSVLDWSTLGTRTSRVGSGSR